LPFASNHISLGHPNPGEVVSRRKGTEHRRLDVDLGVAPAIALRGLRLLGRDDREHTLNASRQRLQSPHKTMVRELSRPIIPKPSLKVLLLKRRLLARHRLQLSSQAGDRFR
jgi:hypothetical protein